uniref:Uncharacterized protein n=1 Tax=Rhizophora mucronata TaxID=61149 RepID=A0A2P2QRP0_RHIMU
MCTGSMRWSYILLSRTSTLSLKIWWFSLIRAHLSSLI